MYYDISINLLSGFFTPFVGQNLSTDTDRDLCQLHFRGLFLFSSFAIPGFCKWIFKLDTWEGGWDSGSSRKALDTERARTQLGDSEHHVQSV